MTDFSGRRVFKFDTEVVGERQGTFRGVVIDHSPKRSSRSAYRSR